MPASRPMDELRAKAADLIINRINDTKEPIKIADAAIKLGISRQALYDIMKRKYCPSLSLVQRACEVWKLEFDFRGVLIKPGVFKKKRSASTGGGQMVQTKMIFEALAQLDNRAFEIIDTKPMGSAFEITLRLTLPAHKTA